MALVLRTRAILRSLKNSRTRACYIQIAFGTMLLPILIAYFSFFFSTLYKKSPQLSEVLEGAVLLRCHTLLYLIGMFVVCIHKLTCTNFAISIISTFAEAINHTINHMCLGIFIARILCFEGNSF